MLRNIENTSNKKKELTNNFIQAQTTSCIFQYRELLWAGKVQTCNSLITISVCNCAKMKESFSFWNLNSKISSNEYYHLF